METVDGSELDYSATGNWQLSLGLFVKFQLPFSFALFEIGDSVLFSF